jgi:hypothetical protein
MDILKEISSVIAGWVNSVMTGQLIITINFNQGGIRSVDITEKTRLCNK